jgi:hypothetical protein
MVEPAVLEDTHGFDRRFSDRRHPFITAVSVTVKSKTSAADHVCAACVELGLIRHRRLVAIPGRP